MYLGALRNRIEYYFELDRTRALRKTTFNHWPASHPFISQQMEHAGFCYLFKKDHVICIYCKLICHGWSTSDPDPMAVHINLSPNCFYVKMIQKSSSTVSSPQVTPNQFHLTGESHSTYNTVPSRMESFNNMPLNLLHAMPTVVDLAIAGFFYCANRYMVICFYCDGAWDGNPTDNLIIEHGRLFPACLYAQQWCQENSDKSFRSSSEVQQNQIEMNSNEHLTNRTRNQSENIFTDEVHLEQIVSDRMDLEISRRMINENFSIEVVRSCWRIQFLLHNNDFINDSQLWFHCYLLTLEEKVKTGQEGTVVIPGLAIRDITNRIDN